MASQRRCAERKAMGSPKVFEPFIYIWDNHTNFKWVYISTYAYVYVHIYIYI